MFYSRAIYTTDLHTIFYTWDSWHLYICTYTAEENWEVQNEIRKRFCIHVRAIMLWLVSHQFIEIFQMQIDLYEKASEKRVTLSDGEHYSLSDKSMCSVLNSWFGMQIMHTRLCAQTPCLSLQGGLCTANSNRKDRWGEGQLAFINHHCWQPEHTGRN